jgi:hypothetical protein
MNRHVYGAVCALAVLFSGRAAVAATAVAPSNYYSFAPPAAGATYADPAFGTGIKRLSNAVATNNDADGGKLQWVLHEYSTPAVFNNDNSRLLLQHGSYFAVYDGNGTFLKNAPFDMSAATEPRWSRSDNNVVYYKRGNQLKSYNVASGAQAVVHTFSEYGAISGNGESDICFDGDHLVLVGDSRQVFVYTLSTGQKGGVFDSGGRGFDSVYISSDDTVTITWLQGGSGRYNGIELFDRNMNFLRQVARAGGHMDMGRDVNGDAVLVWANAADPTPICDNGVVKIRLRDGQQTCLVSLDWNLAFHVSSSEAGWAVVSTYMPSDPNPASFWPAYSNEIFRIRLDGSSIQRLAHHRSRPFNGYNYMSKASINRDGSRIVFSSNFGLQAQGYPTEYSDVYMITLGGGTPVPTAPVTPVLPVVPPATGPATSTAQYRLYSPQTGEHLYTADTNEYAVLGRSGWKQEGAAYRTLTNGTYAGLVTVPLYRLFNSPTRQHHWTTDANEVLTLAQRPGWTSEGIASFVLPAPTAGAVALRRLVLVSAALHLWTTDTNERNVLVGQGWTDEGVIGYVLP